MRARALCTWRFVFIVLWRRGEGRGGEAGTGAVVSSDIRRARGRGVIDERRCNNAGVRSVHSSRCDAHTYKARPQSMEDTAFDGSLADIRPSVEKPRGSMQANCRRPDHIQRKTARPNLRKTATCPAKGTQSSHCRSRRGHVDHTPRFLRGGGDSVVYASIARTLSTSMSRRAEILSTKGASQA